MEWACIWKCTQLVMMITITCAYTYLTVQSLSNLLILMARKWSVKYGLPVLLFNTRNDYVRSWCPFWVSLSTVLQFGSLFFCSAPWHFLAMLINNSLPSFLSLPSLYPPAAAQHVYCLITSCPRTRGLYWMRLVIKW